MTPEEHRAYHAAKQREYEARNKEKVKARKKKYREENKEKIAAAYREWYLKNRPAKKRYKQHVDGFGSRIARAEQRRNRYNENPNVRIRQRIHSDMWKITRGVLKSGWLFRLLGCTLDELSRHIEAQFLEGMTFDNLGEWEVDHIKQLSTFDLTDPEQLAAACHYSNLRPLWKEDNRGRGI